MAQFQLQQIPTPDDMKTVRALNDYIKQLFPILSKWQMTLNNTKFLGSASGHLTISDVPPTPDDGEDEDIWVKYG